MSRTSSRSPLAPASWAVPGVRAMQLVCALTLLAPIAFAQQLPPPPVPPENPITPEKAVLGKILFWEEQLSSDGTIACGTCHLPEFGGSDPRTIRTRGHDGILGTADDVFGSPGMIRAGPDGGFLPSEQFGFEPQVTGRFSPSFLIAPYADFLFWDGRAGPQFIDPQTDQVSIPFGGTLEAQSVAPLLSSVEMAHEGRHWSDLLAQLAASVPMALASDLPPDVAIAVQQDPTYPDLFARAFGDPTLTIERIAYALATYQRTLVPDQTPWDLGTMSATQTAGAQVFIQKKCISCHLVPTFTNNQFHNIGVRPISEDSGRFEVTGIPADLGRFRSPTVRNAALRPAFMHNGGIPDLVSLIEFYDRGGDFLENLDLSMAPLNLTAQEKSDLHEFMVGGLTDPRVAHATAPFDRPTLYSERSAASPQKYGAYSTGSGGFFPRLVAVDPPKLGNPGFRIGLHEGLGNAEALVMVSRERAPPGTLWNGVPLNVNPAKAVTLWTTILDGNGPGRGHGTFQMGLPGSPALAGTELFFQWFVRDAAAEGGLAASRGVRIRLF